MPRTQVPPGCLLPRVELALIRFRLWGLGLTVSALHCRVPVAAD